jgi:hypothetical protein
MYMVVSKGNNKEIKRYNVTSFKKFIGLGYQVVGINLTMKEAKGLL